MVSRLLFSKQILHIRPIRHLRQAGVVEHFVPDKAISVCLEIEEVTIDALRICPYRRETKPPKITQRGRQT